MARRDTAAFAEFVSSRSPALHRSAYLMVGDHALAQDLVQEAHRDWVCHAVDVVMPNGSHR